MLEEERYVALNAMITELERAKWGAQLLQHLYLELGPYQNGKIDPDTWSKVLKFLNFDDEE